MPIPTRSASLREPRKQSANVGSDGTSSSRTKTLLPVSNARSALPQRATKPSQDGQPQQQQSQSSQESTLPTRQHRLVRPTQLRAPSSAKPSTISTTCTRTTVGRGPSSPVKRSDPARQNGQPQSPKKTDMPPPPPRLNRSASLRQPASVSSGTPTVSRGHARHRSQVITPASSNTQRKTETPQTTPTTATPRLRTQFTTYQQHFSPKKTPTQPSPAPSVAATLDLDPSLVPSSWPEIAALQTELLQLGLLHKSWLQRNARRENDAEAQLRSKYDSVAKAYRDILDAEKESQRRLNGQALSFWRKNSRERNGQHGFAEQIQVLSQVAQEMYDLSDSAGGRYTLAVLKFENWLQGVEEVKNTRLLRAGGHGSVVFIDPLDRQWKDEVNALTMKLDLALRQLQSLDILGYGDVEALDGSALFRTAKGLDEMLSLMVDELNAIRKIEADIVKYEQMWASQLAQQLVEMRSRDVSHATALRTGLWKRSSSAV